MSHVPRKDHDLGIQKALSLAPDPDSGTVALQDQLPPVWQEIAKERIMRVLKLNLEKLGSSRTTLGR